MYDELKANVFSKLPKRIVQMFVFVREMKQSTFISSHHSVFHFILMYFKNLAYFFYTQELNWNCQKRMYAKHSVILSVQFSAEQPC